jgi:hypothetical protein
MPPRYKEIAVVGPPHDRVFTMGVLDPNDKILTTATARNKKVAEQEASRAALEMLEPSLNQAFNVPPIAEKKSVVESPTATNVEVKQEVVEPVVAPATKAKVVKRRAKVSTADL